MIIKNGDYDFASLYKAYSKAMFNICMRMTGDQTRSKDILQDGFIIAIQQIDKLRSPEKFGGWLKRIIVNECIREIKRSVSWDDIDDFNLEIEDEETVYNWWESISIEAIYDEIKNLPNGCRQVFLLFAIEDYSHKEIAQIIGVSESTSKTQYKRAKQLLKNTFLKKLKNYG